MRKLSRQEPLDQKLLHELFDLVGGSLIYKVSTNSRVSIGDIAGNLSGAGYLSVKLGGRRHYIHRLVWLYVYGTWPTELDHIDCNKLNNLVSNLRESTRSENLYNSRKQLNNTPGYRGVTLLKCGKWQAQISVEGKYKYLGIYPTALEASNVYETSAKELQGEFYRPPDIL